MWILLVFIGCMISQTSGKCYDPNLSLYVTGDGYIRARLSAATLKMAANGYIGTRCGLRCGCFAMVFLCCSDNECITMDHACPPRRLHRRQMSLHSSPQLMDQSQFKSDSTSIHTERLDPEVNLVQGQGHDVPALIAHAPPQPHEGQSPVYTDSTVSTNAISSNVIDHEAFASSVRNTNVSTPVTHSSQLGKKRRLKLIEVLKLMMNKDK
ncbi:uncharacterized protein LOC124264862 [Haliotis rubra]|uniref:uncharacterized protein LOC124264862 n=1 Tax=Haliotis rubra TaxID=36100 RepID=UPI001EE55EFE|nr:uncharacterized protein LOC124264862 [Haliotis rubra]